MSSDLFNLFQCDGESEDEQVSEVGYVLGSKLLWPSFGIWTRTLPIPKKICIVINNLHYTGDEIFVQAGRTTDLNNTGSRIQ